MQAGNIDLSSHMKELLNELFGVQDKINSLQRASVNGTVTKYDIVLTHKSLISASAACFSLIEAQLTEQATKRPLASDAFRSPKRPKTASTPPPAQGAPSSSPTKAFSFGGGSVFAPPKVVQYAFQSAALNASPFSKLRYPETASARGEHLATPSGRVGTESRIGSSHSSNLAVAGPEDSTERAAQENTADSSAAPTEKTIKSPTRRSSTKFVRVDSSVKAPKRRRDSPAENWEKFNVAKFSLNTAVPSEIYRQWYHGSEQKPSVIWLDQRYGREDWSKICGITKSLERCASVVAYIDKAVDQGQLLEEALQVADRSITEEDSKVAVQTA